MFHPLRSIRETVLIWAEFLASLRATLQENTAALQANTASNAEILNTLKSILLEAAHTEKAVTYLASVERHRQIAAGQPHTFNEVSH